MDLSQKPKPYFWILNPIHLIRYRFDTFLDYPNCILGWILTWPDPGWAKSAQVESSEYWPKSSQVVSAQSWAKSTLGQFELSGLKPKSVWADASRFRPGLCRYELPQDDVKSSGLGWVGVGRHQLESMWSWVFLSRWRAKRAQDKYRTERAQGYRSELARVNVELSRFRPMSSWVFRVWYRVK